jgi:BirA family biotin operon repressor/biotin-[acetyl-CoA-carboxylase] ligase
MKPLAAALLAHLADGAFHSGEALARALGVTRGSVWHAARALEAMGLDLYRVRGRGYRLPAPLTLLDAAQIERRLGAHAARFRLEIAGSVESTNSVLLARAAAGAPHGSVLAAEWQSAGRGRQGRPWHAEIGGALTFSLLWRFAQGASALAGLSLAVGIAIARVLRTFGAEAVALKWPNDVLWREAKLAGILTELSGDALGPTAAVIGIGLNVRLSQAVRTRIGQAAADLETACGSAPDRNALLAALLAELAQVLDAFARAGFAPLRAEWQRLHAHAGRRVALRLPDGTVRHGIARGVAEDGGFLLEMRSGTRRFYSGEISLRLEDTRGRRVV